MLLRTDSGLCAVGVSREELLAECSPLLVEVACEVHIVLLVHRLKLSVESAYNHVLEAVSLDACPVVNLVRRYVLHIARHVVACISVGAVGSDGSHQLVVLVRDEILRSNL